MTPDEARKLLGGYATGSLSEAERTALFQAALEDQALFDELAGEQVLKEVLDEPGARQRLISALEPPKHRAWVWSWGWGWAGAAAALAIAIGVVVLQRTSPPAPQQIAQVLKAPEPAAPQPAAIPAPALESAPVKRKAAPGPSPEPQPAPEPPPAELRKEEALADQVQEAKPQAPAPQALRGFAPAAPQAAAAPAPAAAAAGRVENATVSVLAAAFGFTYALNADGSLQITPAVPGFLAVTAGDVVLFPSGTVPAGTPVKIQIPPGTTSVVIGFSRTPGITGAPVRRDSSAGREADQDPPNGRILIQLFLTPATR